MISPLEGGARRGRLGRLIQPPGRRRANRRRRRWLAGAVGAVAAAAGAGALWMLVAAGDGATIEGALPVTPSRSIAAAATPETTPAAVSLTSPDAFAIDLDPPPAAGLLFDLASGEVLWRRNPLKRLPIASLTKIMTALIVAERTSAGARARITPTVLRYQGSGVGVLPKGKRVSVEALLHGLLMVSGNDAALALSTHVAGSERRFVELMNRRAGALALRCTRFVSSYGLQRRNTSCAADLAALTRLAMGHARIARVARSREAALPFPIEGGRLYLTNMNPLLRLRYPGAIGLKTGYTTHAGRCFVAVARRGGREFGVVLLDSADPALQARRLLDRAFRLGEAPGTRPAG